MICGTTRSPGATSFIRRARSAWSAMNSSDERRRSGPDLPPWTDIASFRMRPGRPFANGRWRARSSSVTRPSSPASRVTIAGTTTRLASRIVPRSMGVKSFMDESAGAGPAGDQDPARPQRSPQKAPRDDGPLDLRRALVDAQGAHLAVEVLDDSAAHEPAAAVDLDGLVDDLLGRFRRA